VCASDGIEALSLLGIPHQTGALNAAASGSAFDICICDDEMPNMSGFELVANVRMNGCKIPIIGITAKPFPDADENFLRAGADAVLLKPIRADSLLCAICDRLGLSRYS
jgi:CheY-like chemotaxis protein